MFTQFAFGDFSTVDLVVILAIILLLFGGKKLPELSRSLGQSMHELRKGMSDSGNEQKSTQKKAEEEESAS